MPDAYWLEQVIGLDTARGAVDGLLAGCLAAAVAVGWLTGLNPVVLAVLVVVSVVLERAVSWTTRRRILQTAEASGGTPDAGLRELVSGLTDRMDVATPHIVVEASPDGGVTVLQGSDGPVLLLSRPLVDTLDGEALRGVIAHELAHLDSGHIGWLDSREPVAHVVGAVAFWVVVGQHLGPVLSLVGLGTYVGAGVFRGSVLPQLYYLCASLGVVLLPLGLIAFAHRLEELQADDRAVDVTDAAAFCRGLYHVAATPDSSALPEELLGTTAAGERRGLLARVTATHPPLERRFSRQGISTEDVIDDR